MILLSVNICILDQIQTKVFLKVGEDIAIIIDKGER
jgi:hypothetical protein